MGQPVGHNTNPGLPLIPVPFATTNRISSSSTDPRVVIDYKISRDAKVYASYSTGYKGAGFSISVYTGRRQFDISA
jgi:iron complex outermembrane receptor protein